MNVLFLDQFSEMGGAQRVLLDTVAAVRELGWNAHAAVPGDGPLVKQLERRGVVVTRIPCGPYSSGKKSGLDVLKFALDLPRQTRALLDLSGPNHFDLVYVNGPRLLPSAALGVGAPVLFHAHSVIPHGNSRRLARWAIRRKNAVVVGCSNSVANDFRDCVMPHNLYVIPNGVREARFVQRGFRRAGNWRVGMLGRISPEKGQAEFLRAVQLVHARAPSARFLIFGAPLFGATDYFETVQDLAHGLPVEFRGWQEDLDTVFDGLDLLVVPSLEEGMGRVVVEAFSAGVPVLAFPTGGIVEVVTDGETGFLTSDRSPAALAARMYEIMTVDPENTRRVAAQARCAWERGYRVELYQERITEVIRQCVRTTAAHSRR